MEKETLAVRWVEHKEESLPERRHNRGHADPTADAAIGHVLLEERRKNKKKRPRTGVWRAEEVERSEGNGVPDRLVLLLGGKCAFVELKAPGKQMRLLQRKRRQQLEALGFPVFCVDRPEQIQPAIDALLQWNPGEPIPQGIGAKIPEMPAVALTQSNTQGAESEVR